MKFFKVFFLKLLKLVLLKFRSRFHYFWKNLNNDYKFYQKIAKLKMIKCVKLFNSIITGNYEVTWYQTVEVSWQLGMENFEKWQTLKKKLKKFVNVVINLRVYVWITKTNSS